MVVKKLVSLGLAVTLPLLGGAALFGFRGPWLAAWSMLLLGGKVVFAVQRSRRAAQRSRDHAALEAGAALAPLRLGACVLEGEVAYADGADRAMRIDFQQVGTESESSGSWSHAWTETHRKLTVQPFYLVRSDGARLRVEPTLEQSQLYDELEAKILVPVQHAPAGAPVRIRYATLVPGERVWITGRLEHGVDPEQAGVAAASGYRESASPTSWIVRGHPLIVSSVSLASHFAARARQHLVHAVVLLACLSAPVAMLARYLDRVAGVTVTVPVDGVANETNDDDRVVGYRARATYRGDRLESDTLDVPPELGSQMEFRVGAFSHNAGRTARFTADEIGLCAAIAIGAVVLGCILHALSARTLPWYRSERVKVTESGSGKLFPGS